MEGQITSLVLLALMSVGHCDILVFTQVTQTIIEEFPDLPAKFGPGVPAMGFKCLAVAGTPSDFGCKDLDPIPATVSAYKWCVVLSRYNCSFELKVRNAQAAGFDAVIIHNVGSDELETMSANNDDGIRIPSIFVGEHTGRTIISDYLFSEHFALLINNESPFNINTHLLVPFTIVVGLCFITMIIFTIVRCCRERRRQMRYRLPKSVLKKIPTVKFAKEVHPYDTCAICLEDYVDGEKLRLLPCAHAYHCKCIDPWLTKNRRNCPMCKRKVFIRGERRPRRRSSSDNSTGSDVDDTTPLLTANDNQTAPDHGTFPQGQSEAASSMSSGMETATPWSSYPAGMSDDDEILDASATTNREGGGGEINTHWQKMKRFLRSLGGGSGVFTSSQDPEAVPIHNEGIGIPSTSNNILNNSLSGSFQRERDGETTDDENILVTTRQNRSTPNLPSSHDIASTSSGDRNRGRIGFAAIPSNSFNPSPPISRGRSNFM